MKIETRSRLVCTPLIQHSGEVRGSLWSQGQLCLLCEFQIYRNYWAKAMKYNRIVSITKVARKRTNFQCFAEKLCLEKPEDKLDELEVGLTFIGMIAISRADLLSFIMLNFKSLLLKRHVELYMCGCVCAGKGCTCHSTGVEIRGQLCNSLSPFHFGVGFRDRPQYYMIYAASAFTQWSISPYGDYFFCCLFKKPCCI